MLCGILAIATPRLMVGRAAAAPGASNAADGSVSAPLRFGVQVLQGGGSWAQVEAAVLEAERLGFDSAWVFDHFAPIVGDFDGPTLEGWTLLSALATRTSRIRLGVLVSGNTYRNPALLAKMAATVDQVSGGRVMLGLGAGWFEREHRAYGFRFGTARERAERLAEALQVIKKLWLEERPSFEGKYYRLSRAPFAPKPIQQPHPPIVIGGQGRKWIVPLVGRYADGWNAVTGVTPEGLMERREIIRRACEEAGRSPCPRNVSVLLPLFSVARVPLYGPTLRLFARFVVGKEVAGAILAGSAKGMIRQIREYVDAGADEVIVSLLPPFKPKLLRRFAEDVMPAFGRPLRGPFSSREPLDS